MQNVLYQYNAVVTSVYDGDSCTVDIDLGLHTWIHGEKIRLMRINAPEIRGQDREKGLVSRNFLIELILGKKVILGTFKDKKAKDGRYLGEIWIFDEEDELINVNDLLVEKGLAEYYEY
ncbi:MAG: thermonuclease family protein [Ignavibacteriaceae bacterium]